jgi:uncharacterized protein with von Willebrand factor type A (vWA) domain
MELSATNSNKPPPSGQLPANIMHFARVLRDTGLPVGPGAVLDALDAVQGGGMSSKKDFYWILHSIFVKRREHSTLFDHAFEVFWRKPKMIEQIDAAAVPAGAGGDEAGQEESRSEAPG